MVEYHDTPSKQPIPCPVCGSRYSKIKYMPWVDVQDPVKLYGATSGIQGTQTLVVCYNCGLIYENPRFPEEIILQGYMAYNETTHDSQHAMRVNSFYRGLQSIQKYLPPKGAKILDVGTAGGGFLEAAQRFGYEAVGLEPSHFMVEQGRQNGLKIEQGSMDNHPFAPASFDMVCLWDVLEHVPNPEATLAAIRKIIKPHGVLLINYPDIGTWMAKLAGRRFWWILSVHLMHFDQRSIRNICERTGFEVFHFQRYWQTLEFGYLEVMAIHLKVPLSGYLKRFSPGAVQSIPVPYYASQTTALARVVKGGW
jgi:SAM-dependent methyltransferase